LKPLERGRQVILGYQTRLSYSHVRSLFISNISWPEGMLQILGLRESIYRIYVKESNWYLYIISRTWTSS